MFEFSALVYYLFIILSYDKERSSFFWPGLGLPRPKAIVVIPKINSCQNYLRKKTSKSAKYLGDYATKKKDPLK